MRILKDEKLDSDTYKLSIEEEYTLDGERIKLKFDAVFKKYDNTYRFYDLYFKTAESKYFTIKYAPSLIKQEAKLLVFIDDAYNNVKQIYGNAPEDKTVVKLYDNNAVFGAFIKPSIKFKMSGWYEYPESIKINMSSMLDRVISDAAFHTTYLETLSHEMTHRINGQESNNNIPYWMAEGLATYVQNNGVLNKENPHHSLSELENINLEKLTDSQEIDEYYMDSYIYISRFIQKYGIDTLHQLLLEMGKYPIQESTAGEIYQESNRRFHEVVQKKLSLSRQQFEEVLSKESLPQ
jgi:hypothetical protein